MNLGETTIVLRHRKIMEVLDLSLRFVRALSARSFVLLALSTGLPGFAIAITLRSVFELHWFLVWCFALAWCQLMELPLLCLTGRLLFERKTSLRDCLREAAGRCWAYVGSKILFFLYWCLSSLILVGPLLVSSSYCFVSEAVVLERAGPLDALSRARKFLRGRGGTGLEVVLLRWVMLAGAVLLFETCGHGLVIEGLDLDVEYETLFEDGGSWFALLGAFASVPHLVVFRFLSYINERTRQDGWDVQVALLGVAEPST